MWFVREKGRYESVVRFDLPSPHGSTGPINTAEVMGVQTFPSWELTVPGYTAAVTALSASACC